MRYRLMATYRGVPYEAGVGPTGGDVVLFAACPPPEELGFEPATGHWRKQVIWAEVDGLWESRPVGTFRGQPCIVLDDLGDRLHIAYLGTEAERAARLGYWQVDRGVFELLTSREEVSGLTEERVDRPLGWTAPPETAPPLPPARPPAGSPPAAAPGRPSYPYGTPDWLASPPPRQDVPSRSNGVPPAPGNGWRATAPPSVLESATGEFPLPTLPTGDFPTATGEFPAATGEFPAPTRGFPAGSAGASPATGEFPTATGEFPAATGEFPAATRGFPAGSAGASPATGEFPTGEFPTTTGEFPAATGEFPAAAPHGSSLASGDARQRRGRTRDAGGGRAARRRRVTTRDIFCELADLAAIPRSAYALEAEVDGAMCLLASRDGFDVFLSVDGARHEARMFSDEEAAYFYLFGVLAAEAIRSGTLAPSEYPGRQ